MEVCYLDDDHHPNKHGSISVFLFSCRNFIGCIPTSAFLYAAIAVALIVPFDIFYSSSRYFLLWTILRIVFPFQAITFSDFFLADIFTSMSKVFSDMECSVCRMIHHEVATTAWLETDSVCGSHSIAIPIVLALPYFFRLCQCLRQCMDAREWKPFINAMKYATVLPMVIFSALKYHVQPVKWANVYLPLWVLSSAVNSLFSFYWDITQDWDLSCLTRIFNFGRPHMLSHMLYGSKCAIIWAIVSNLILRVTWTYKLSSHLRHNHITVFALTALEIFRRFQWILFRVENEWNKMTSSSNARLPITDEEEALLDSNDHDT